MVLFKIQAIIYLDLKNCRKKFDKLLLSYYIKNITKRGAVVITNLNKIYLSDGLEFSSFEVFKRFCEGLESVGYRLNISDCSYVLENDTTLEGK